MKDYNTYEPPPSNTSKPSTERSSGISLLSFLQQHKRYTFLLVLCALALILFFMSERAIGKLIGSSLFLGIVLLPLLLIGLLFYHFYWRYRVMELIADTPWCRLCEGKVELCSSNNEYECQHCGYTNTHEDVPSLSTMLSTFQDLKTSRGFIESAIQACDELQMYSTLARPMLETRETELSRKSDAMKEVLDHTMTSQRLLQDLIEEHPELLDTPDLDSQAFTELLVSTYISDDVVSEFAMTEFAEEHKNSLYLYLQHINGIMEHQRSRIFEELHNFRAERTSRPLQT